MKFTVIANDGQALLTQDQLRQQSEARGSMVRDQAGPAADRPSAFARMPSGQLDPKGSAGNSPRGLQQMPSSIARMPSGQLDPKGSAGNSPRGLHRTASGASNASQGSERIAAVRSSDSTRVSISQADGAAAAAEAGSHHSSVHHKHRQRSMMQKDLTRRSSVADRLKSVRGMLAAAEDTGMDDIQEDLPKPAVAASEDVNADEPIAEEPQLAVN